jgi:hypothetical protein
MRYSLWDYAQRAPGGLYLPGGTRRRLWTLRQPGYFVTTFTPTKTAQTDLQIWADFASGTYTEGSSLDVSAMFAAAIKISVGRLTGTAFTAGFPNIRIQGSTATSGNDRWADLFVFQPPVGASIGATTANGAIAANAATYALTSATNFVVNDLNFLGHTTTPANYELIKTLSGTTTVTPVHNVVNAHDTGCVITSQASEVLATIGLQGINRLRSVVDNNGSGQGIKVRVECTTFTNVVGA